VPVINPKQLIAGFQGALCYEDGSRWAAGTSLELTAAVNTNDVRPLGEFFTSVAQGATLELAVSEAVINDEIARRVLDDLAQSRVPSFRFIGERYDSTGRRSHDAVDLAPRCTLAQSRAHPDVYGRASPRVW
jgi:hypothetical protein